MKLFDWFVYAALLALVMHEYKTVYASLVQVNPFTSITRAIDRAVK